ncbi:transposase, partial [Patescibacteria group bacterium]|nr:transposase [Patescibacteria group bacterium]
LTNLANLMEKYKKELFTCVVCKGVAPTNNKAEQKLRHLVLKRKNSFGTKSEKGNKILSINLSIILPAIGKTETIFLKNSMSY